RRSRAMTSEPVLGRPAPLPPSPEEAALDTVPNPQPGLIYLVRFTCPEFTALCPVTGQPDFAHFVVDYVPEAVILESKSLKLFLGSFRNHAAFHEDCTLGIARRLVAALSPRWLRIGGYWYPRGGIPIDVFYQAGESDPLVATTDAEGGAISVYARGDDYHDTLKRRFKALARWIAARWPGELKVFVDTAPVMEKPLAQQAGIGWQGKHTNLVS